MLPSILKEKGVDHLHYMAHIENAKLILALGIFSYNKGKKIPHVDVSMERVQWLRKNTKLPNGKSIHDYVPLYFGIFTPMQYVLTYGSSNYDNPIGRKNLVFFEIDAEQVFSQDGIYFTDGNAASFFTQIYNDFDKLERLDWHIIMNVRKCLSQEYKRKKAAEVLVPNWVPPSWFTRVVVYCQNSQDYLYEEFKNIIPTLKEAGLDKYLEIRDDIPIEIDYSHYF